MLDRAGGPVLVEALVNLCRPRGSRQAASILLWNAKLEFTKMRDPNVNPQMVGFLFF